VRTALVVTVALALGLAAAPLPAATPSQAPADHLFDRLFQAYAAGDVGVVERMLKTDKDYQAIRKDMQAAIARWRRDWQPIDAVFLLEVSTAAFNAQWQKPEDVLTSAAEFVTSRVRGRPRDLGPDPALDAFEDAWHKTALALLQKHLRPLNIEDYLKAVDWRIGATGRNTANPRLVEPHFALVHAIAREQMLTPDTIAYYLRSSVAPLAIGWLPGPNGQMVARNVDEALKALDAAATLPGEGAEASVRKAFLLHRLNHMGEALALLDGIEHRTTDQAVVYLGLLFRGRTLQMIGRPDEAGRAFELALEAWPHAQAPAVALAALSLQQNRHDVALRWAAAARTTPADRVDPWWQYWLGDARFLPEWMADLRKAAR
jgi:hypothetical protein